MMGWFAKGVARLRPGRLQPGRFGRAAREDGNATIEFVLLFPILITLFLNSFEVGFFLVRSVMLERAVDKNVRAVRLGELSPNTPAELKRRICADTLIFRNCENDLTLELTPVSKSSWTLPSNRLACVDRVNDIRPNLTFQPGVANELMLVRACVVMDPFFPTSAWVMDLPVDASGGYEITAMSTFVNEP